MNLSGYLRGAKNIGGIGAPAAPFEYTPDLGPVGSGNTYFPGDVEQDAAALNFLGFLSDVDDANRAISKGSLEADQSSDSGAWDNAFRQAVLIFQSAVGITTDGWIGPQTRGALVTAVNGKNANPDVAPPPLPAPGSIPIAPSSVPAKPLVLTAKTDETLTFVGVGAGVLALCGLGWVLLRKKKRA